MIARVMEHFDAWSRRKRQLLRQMKAAGSYEEWARSGRELDRLHESHPRAAAEWQRRDRKLYDRKLLVSKMEQLREVRKSGDIRALMFLLRADLLRNMGNMTNPELHQHYHVAPEPVQAYIAEVEAQLAYIADAPVPELAPEAKRAFLQETRHAFGRTALLLSGGGALGCFHLGVVKVLYQHGLLPRIIAGSSVGSIVSGILATHTDSELEAVFNNYDALNLNFFQNATTVEFVTHVLRKGTLQDMDFLVARLRTLLGDLTFLEAYERTGRILNVSVCPADTNEPPRMLNYLTAPQAVVWSAVAASSAFPGLFPAQELLARNHHGHLVPFSAPLVHGAERRWRDGSLELDLPVRELSEMFNVNYFLVSQTNPHLVPLLALKRTLSSGTAHILETEWKHRCRILQWMLPDWIPSKWLNLFTQTWEGDVTICLPYHHCSVSKAIVNPTPKDLATAIAEGEHATWRKLSAIRCGCAIEARLDAGIRSLQRPPSAGPRIAAVDGTGVVAVQPRRLLHSTSRVPSWLHMSAMGISVSPSADSLKSLQTGDLQTAASVKAALTENSPEAAPAPDTPEGSAAGALYGRPSSRGAEATPATVPAVPLSFDCCDSSAVLSLWDSLLPHGSVSLDTHRRDRSASYIGLDVIAP